ncbi:MAG: hypothetical protein D6730_09220 [Bacteroidetes bacterium]|nr:MAG: hypothetical protein D6730_09220 [Bacteroidota bacterium]
MNKTLIFSSILMLIAFWACQPGNQSASNEEAEIPDSLRYEGETHLKNVQQLTFGGNNAEAYFSFDYQQLVLQREHQAEGIPCDQIFYTHLPASRTERAQLHRISNGQGRTTCAYFLPGDSTIVYASTHLSGPDCPPDIDRAKIRKYVWPIYNSYELFIADKAGNILAQLTDNEFYDAEATVSPRGDRMVFTSTRNGDLDLYTMNLDGSDVQQVTHELGYDGGAFFSADGSKLVFRASRFESEAEKEEYKELLAQGMVAPTNMEVFVCNVDGSELQQITHLGKANWAPFFHPSGKKIIFSSNHASESGRKFNLYMINIDGTGLEQITYDEQFDAFAMFNGDATKLVWASNRNNGGTRETNIFIADWVE